MAKPHFFVKAVWDEEAKVWVATSDDVPGLITEALTCDALVEKLKYMIPELLEANNALPEDADGIPFQLLSEVNALAHRRVA